MIHIHRCTFLAHGNSAWENGSTISVNRVKDIIAKQLEGLENLPGRIHLKKLTLDLGNFDALEFNGEFIERLEHSCRDLEGKLRELQRTQIDEQNSQDKKHLDDLVAFLYGLDYTQEVQNAIALLESTGFAPKLEDWGEFESRYKQQFGNSMNSKLKKSMKSELISSKSVKEKSTPTTPFPKKESQEGIIDFKQEHIDFLIESLDRIPMTTNWFKTLDDLFSREFGTKMSTELYNQIRKVYDSFEFGLDRKKEQTQSNHLPNDKLGERLLQFFKELDDSEENREISKLFKKMETSNSHVFFSELIAKYKREFGKTMPIELERQLVRFQQRENPPTWSNIDRTKRQRILNKLNLLKELESSVSHSEKKPEKSKFSEEEYIFLCDQLSQLFVDASWYSKLLSNYQRQFQKPMPKNLQRLFLKFSQDVFVPVKNSMTDNQNESEILNDVLYAIRRLDPRSKLLSLFQSLNTEKLNSHDDFIQFYQEHFGHDIYDEDLSLLVQVNRLLLEQGFNDVFSRRQKEFYELFKLDPKSSKDKGRSKEATQDLNIRLDSKLFDDIQFDLAWMSKIEARFREVYQRGLPRGIKRKILRFLRNIKGSSTVKTPLIGYVTDSRKVLILNFRRFLIDFDNASDVEDLLQILPPVDSSQKWLDIEEVMTGFKAFYGRSISSKLKRIIWSYHEESLPENLRLITKELSTKGKAAIEKHTRTNSSLNSLETETTELFKEFLSTHPDFIFTKPDVLSDFQQYLKNETGRILSKNKISLLTHLLNEVRAQSMPQNKSKLNFDELRSELNKVASPADSNKLSGIDSSDELQLNEKQSSGVLHPNFLQRAVDFMLNYLSRMTLSKGWVKSLNEAFRKEFKSEIPKDWPYLLEQFNNEILNSNVKGLPVELMKSKFIVYLKQNSEIIGSEELLTLLSEARSIDSAELKRAVSDAKSAESKISDSLAEEKFQKKPPSGVLHPDFVKPAIDFILSFLNQTTLSKDWLKSLIKAFRKEFKLEVPKEWQDLLERYDREIPSSKDKELPVESVKSKLIVYLTQNLEIQGSEKLLKFLSELDSINSLEVLFEQFETRKNEALPLGLKMMLYRWLANTEKEKASKDIDQIKEMEIAQIAQVHSLIDNYLDEKQEEQKDIMHFLHYMLDAVPLDACWLATVSERYTRQFKQNIPADLFNSLLEFTDEFSGELELFYQNKERNDPNSSDLMTLFDEVTLGMDDSVNLDRLKEVFAEMSMSNNSFSIVKLIERFKRNFDEDIPQDLLEKIAFIHSRTAKCQWAMLPTNQRKELIESIKEVLISETQRTKSEGQGKDEFNSKLVFLIHTLEQTSVDASWFAKLQAAYTSEFGGEIPNELRDCLLIFSEKLVSRSKTIDQENQNTLIQDQVAVKYFLSLHFTPNEAVNLSTLLSEIDVLKNPDWLDELISKFESKYASFTESQIASLLEFEKLIPHGKRALTKDSKPNDFLSELDQLKKGFGSTQNDKNTVGQTMIDFTSKFFSENEINMENLNRFERSFHNKFGVKMNARLTAFILRHLNEDSSIIEEENSILHTAISSFEKVKSERRIDASTDLEFLLESKAFLSAKLEQLIFGWTNLSQVKTEYFELFGVEISPDILAFWDSKLSLLITDKGIKPSVINELNQFLRKTGTAEQVAIISQLLEGIPEISKRNWFESILNAHKEHFNSSLPLDLQQLLLGFANRKDESKRTEAKLENESFESWKNEGFTSWLSFADKLQEKLKNVSDSVTLKQADFISAWLKNSVLTAKELFVLEMQFHKEFQSSIPKGWKALLIEYSEQVTAYTSEHFGSDRALNSAEDIHHLKDEFPTKITSVNVTKIRYETFRKRLMSYIEGTSVSDEKNVLIKLIRLVPDLSENSWFEQLLDVYKSVEGMNMPVSIQGALLKFMQENSEASFKAENESNLQADPSAIQSKLSLEMNSKLDEVYMDSLDRDNPEFDMKEFLSNLLIQSQGRTAQIEKSWKHWFGFNLPESIKLELNDALGINQDLKSGLLAFLKNENAQELIQLVNALVGELSRDNWMDKINSQFESKLSRGISKEERSLLLTFAVNDEFTTIESNKQTSISASKSKLVESLVTHIMSNGLLQARLNERYQLINHSIERSKSKSSLDSVEKKELQSKILVYLGEKKTLGDLQMMIETIRRSPEKRESNSVARSKLRPAKPSKRKMISNKVKLIRLREELEAMKEGKKVDESTIVMNAGLIFGWVLWKSIFTNFSWLDDGEFIRKDEMNSANLAANWLHYSVAERESVNPLILLICGLDEKEFKRLTEEQLEGEMNGESLSDSVEGYYQMILSMWTIFPAKHLPDYIELFVERDALMQKSPVGTRLKLVKEPIDALVDKNPLPWPISIINFSWTTQIIEVEW